MSRTQFLTRTIPHLGAVSPLLLVLMLAACGSDSNSPTAPDGAVASVTVSPANDTLVLGGTTLLRARAEDAGGNGIFGTTFTWTSSNMSVATVEGVETSSLAFATGAGEGSATITATTNGKSATAAVTVQLVDLASVDAGTFHTCGLTTTGEAYCWGINFDSGLGVGLTTLTCPGFSDGSGDACSTTPKAVSGRRPFVSISVANGFTCGLTTSGAAYCWGHNSDGRLGTGDTLRTTVPVAVVGGLSLVSVSAGGAHSCGLTATGAAYCWGSNEHSQLGTTSASETCQNRFSGDIIPCSTTPVPVSGGLTFASVTAGGGYACGLTPIGAAYCWGENSKGQLGIGDTLRTTVPVAVAGGFTFTSVSAGGAHTCGLTTTGTAYCWGYNWAGHLGDGSTSDRTTPVAVSGDLAFGSVNAGDSHTCGVTTSGAAYCWGNNFDGQLGNGTDVDRTAPSAVSGGLTFATVSGSFFHTCGFTTSGTAYCWGANEFGQLGEGTRPSALEAQRSPVRVLGQR